MGRAGGPATEVLWCRPGTAPCRAAPLPALAKESTAKRWATDERPPELGRPKYGAI